MNTSIFPYINAVPNTYPSPSIFTNTSINTSTIGVTDANRNEQFEKTVLDNLAKINERLMIITPDIYNLEKFTALKAAYDQFKVIESLCFNTND